MSIDEQINYDDAIEYWSGIPATVNGVLGGYGPQTSVPRADIIGSMTFLRRLRHRYSAEPGKAKVGMDVGAGIGRVTKELLSKVCDRVDLLEPVEPFVAEMKIQLEPLGDKIGDIYEMGMQDWVPEPAKYMLIWCQWVCVHLPDDELVKFLQRCKDGLQEDGLLVLKENNSIEDVFDAVDSSKTRSDASFRHLFKRAGWKLVGTCLQTGVPRELYPIRMYALKPKPDQIGVKDY